MFYFVDNVIADTEECSKHFFLLFQSIDNTLFRAYRILGSDQIINKPIYTMFTMLLGEAI